MKTNLTILALFVALMAKTQITIDSVTPTRICAGDSITYHYTCYSPGTYQFNLDGSNHDYIWQVTILDTVAKHIRFKVPFWWNDGLALASTDWVNTFNVTFCTQVGITEYDKDKLKTYKQIYGNIYLSNEGKKVIFVEP